MPGEYVIKRDAVQRYGVGTFEALNAQRMAAGGVVGSTSGSPPAVGAWTDSEWNKTLNAIESATASAAAAAIKSAEAASISAGGIGLGGVSNRSAVAALQSAAAKAGWTGAMWEDLVHVEMAEAGFNIHAQNPSSGAYGMAQFINGPSEYYQYGGNPNTAAGQAVAMVNYIRQRYGNPAAAWAHEEADHWYAMGGPVGMSGGGPPMSGSPIPGPHATSHKHWLDAVQAHWLKEHHKSVYGKGTHKHPWYTGDAGWAWLLTHEPPHGPPTGPKGPSGTATLAQKLTKAFAAMQTAMAAEDKAEKGLAGAKYPHGKNSGKPYRVALSTLGKRQNMVDQSWGKLTADRNSMDLLTSDLWKTAIGDSDTMRKWTDKKWVQILAKQHPDLFANLHKKIKTGEQAEKNAYAAWLKLYGPGGPDYVKNGPPTPAPKLYTGGMQGIPTPNISALLPYAPPASYASGGMVGFGGGLSAAHSVTPNYAMPHFATGGLVLPEPARGVAPGAAAVAGASKSSGPLIGNMTINNPVAEPASGSITRGVQRAAFLAGRGEV